MEITVFERASYIGGRSTTVNVFGNPSYPVELGASIFVHENTNLVNATRDLGLKVKGSSSSSTSSNTQTSQKRQESKASEDDADSIGIWDGSQFVYSVKGSFNWWEIGKLVWRFGLSPFKAQGAMKDTIQKFKEMYQAPIFPFQSLTDAVEKAGLLNTMASPGADFLRKNGVSDDFAREIIQSSTRVNYGQNLPLIHGVETMVCLAAEGSMSIQGGNWQIFEGMVAASGANIRLNTSVTFIERNPSNGTVTLKTANSNNKNKLEDPSLTFDEVVIAGPLQYSGLSISPPLEHTPDEIPYVKLHVTLFASPHLLSPKYFGLDTNARAPNTVLTTLPKGVDLGSSRAGVGPAGFWSISTLDTVTPSSSSSNNNNNDTSQKQYVYKIFSPERVTANFMSEILGLEAPTGPASKTNGSIADLPKEDISWFYEKIWNPYPFEYPRVTFQDPVVAPNVWYTSGIESFISTMETSSLMGRNVATLMVDGWQGK